MTRQNFRNPHGQQRQSLLVQGTIPDLHGDAFAAMAAIAFNEDSESAGRLSWSKLSWLGREV